MTSMTETLPRQPGSKRKSRLNLWFEQMMVILIGLNYLLVLFDLSYVPNHDFWQQGTFQFKINTPNFQISIPHQPIQILPFRVTERYDWVKGIEPLQESVEYLTQVEQLKQLDELGPESEEILTQLRNLSNQLLTLDTADEVRQIQKLEILKNRMRQHIFGSNQASVQEAFQTFWSRDHLLEAGFTQELAFFEQQMRPLMETLDVRLLDANSQPVNYFWVLDLPFMTLFFIEFIWRTRLLSRNYISVSWSDAIWWRWYDIFLFLPFWRLLRIIPLGIRLNHAKLLNLKPIQRRASRGFVSSFAEDLVQVVMIFVINQMQTSISQGELQKFLRQRQQLDNQTNEIAEILKILFQTTVYKVVPNIRPEAEALLKYNFEKALAQSSIYPHLQQWPSLKNLEQKLSEQFSSQFFQAFSETLMKTAKDDPKFNQLLERLLQSFNQNLGRELQGRTRINQLESLVTEFLEQVKINYVKPLSAEDLEVILEQTRLLRAQFNDLAVGEPTLIRRSE